jgi:hypothetical protein
MSGKVLATVEQLLTLDRIDAMAERAAIDRASARKAAELGVPAILTALTERLGRAGGLARLTQALAMGSSDLGPKPEGSGGIKFLLGGECAGALASAIGRFVGARESSTLTFLDELSAAILGALGQASGDANADGRRIANVLKAERDDIAAAMPPGLASLLGAPTVQQRPGGPGLALSAPLLGSPDAAPGARRTALSRAAWAVVLIASTGMAWYVLTAGVNKPPSLEIGDGVVSALPASDVRPAGQAATPATARLQGRHASTSAGHVGSTLTDTFGGSEEPIATSLVRLGRFFGIGRGSVALSVTDLPPWLDRGLPEARRPAGAAKAQVSGPSAPVLAPQPLRFVTEEFRDAILPAPETPAGTRVSTK